MLRSWLGGVIMLLCHPPALIAKREYGIFTGFQYYGPPLDQETYDRVANASKIIPIYLPVCADHNDTGGGAEHRTGDPRDGGRIVPLCDLGDDEGATVRKRLETLRAAGTKVMHYVHTRLTYYPNGTEMACCKCCEDEPYVLSRVANETKNFPTDGIFVDNAVANEVWYPYYKAIISRAREQDPNRMIGTNANCAHAPADVKCSPYCEYYGHSAAMCADCSNPHCSRLTEQWFDMADVHTMSEASVENGRVLDFDIQLPFEPTEDQKSKIGMVTYGANASSWRGLIDRAKAKGFSKFWVDGQRGGNTTSFLSLPPWFEEMVTYIASFNAAEN